MCIASGIFGIYFLLIISSQKTDMLLFTYWLYLIWQNTTVCNCFFDFDFQLLFLTIFSNLHFVFETRQYIA